MPPGTKIRLLEPIFDPVSRLMGIHVEWLPAGSVGTIDKDGQTVSFDKGTPEKLSEIDYEVVPDAKQSLSQLQAFRGGVTFHKLGIDLFSRSACPSPLSVTVYTLTKTHSVTT